MSLSLAATGAVAAVPVVGAPAAVGIAAAQEVGALVDAVASLFGTGDTSPFQDQRIRDLATLAAKGDGWAFQSLCGESGRWGLVWITGGRAAHLPEIPSGQQGDVHNWWVGGASNTRGDGAWDKVVGPTTRYGTQDLAYQAAQMVAQHYGVSLPAPTMDTVDGGYKNVGNIAGTGIPLSDLPGNYQAKAATPPLTITLPTSLGTSAVNAVNVAIAKVGGANVAGFGIVAVILLGLLAFGLKPSRKVA